VILLVGQGVLDVLSSGSLIDVAGPVPRLDLVMATISLSTLAVAPVALRIRTPLPRRALPVAFGLQLSVALIWTVALILRYGDGWVGSAATAAAGLLYCAVAPTVGLLLTMSEPARRWFARPDGDQGPYVTAPAAFRPPDVPAPSAAVAAGVLACSLAALSVPGALVTALATSSFSAQDDALYEQSVVVTELESSCPIPLVVGAVLLFQGIDRYVLVGAAAVVFGISGWWIWAGASGALGAGGELVFLPALLFAGPAVTAAVLALQPSVGGFLGARRGA